MTRQHFGTDGIRGTVGQPPITPDFVLRLAHAVGRVLRQTQERPVVLIGKDTRISGYMLESALESGFNSAGVDVVLLGPLPTPGVAYLTCAQRASLGVVISASHNPYPDNGIKFFSAQGSKLSDAWEQAVETALGEPPAWTNSANLGKARRLNDAAERYIEFCKNTFAQDLSLEGLKIVLDAAHGAAYQVGPKVLRELEAEVIAIGCSPDGLNINHEVGATHPDTLVRAVHAHHADYGIALDGDADRVLIVDATGRLYNGDELLYLMVADRMGRDEHVPGVVGTLMTNRAVELALQARGVEFVRAKVGDRYILEELTRRDWALGGEGSGHLLALDRHTTGDGIGSALQVLQACVRSRSTLAQLLAAVTLYPQVLLNVRLPPGQDWTTNRLLADTIQAVEQQLGVSGRVLIRASGTEPLLRVMVEARDAQLADSCAQRLANAARAGWQVHTSLKNAHPMGAN
ncbi:phosphoglucosamine mutase [Verminephrobacter eiseniae]|uniref:phosphoglucosamine mutase n=1 Tax=Verminephrobacter eiseniae TaxID=364317 RepID=UPI0010E758AB|nr:phosphoglucosamine mutase [Verminephrobacter eiseniae]KAB7597414.1 phosphoglucosamine mutase [Verminephrobacter sp. Larva24]MCW5233028.1 phosphoglucosamine mutase [Verminephrobacter eiseniae]MCW5295416.1 phosphoglucosamine mutase [Verminephrobacter eiseniae]MCW8187832.1 phosphoglucosamine mutase [Verminephrobacter eiseniae]MCW8222977.1 phosphoglucosamine mutase [Verminephrobacter eiseniae]